jgi:nucleoprotein TPR
MMKTKAADAEKQAAVVTEAVEKAKADMSNSADPATQETLQKRHAEELRSLEEKLTTKHEADLKARVESAVAEALKARPTTGADADQKPAIEAAIAEYEKQAQARRAEEMVSIEARHAEEIASAVDRGRMEQVAKGKLKDSQLVKAQKRVKELEASIHEWEAQGIKLPPIKSTVVATAPPPSAVSSVQMAAKVPPLTVSTSSAGPSQPKPTPTAPAANATPLARRPAPTGPAGPSRGGAIRGVGRGAPSGVGRGGLRTAPVKITAPSPISVAPTAGVSIMGAATKRPREEGVPAEDQSLVKRLKPAEP